MSQQNVERHRRVIEAYNAQDVEAFIALCDPSVEVYSVFAAVDGGRLPRARRVAGIL